MPRRCDLLKPIGPRSHPVGEAALQSLGRRQRPVTKPLSQSLIPYEQCKNNGISTY